MPVVTVRNLPPETHRALKVRAAQHGRSTEAEIREILEEAMRPAARVKIGSELAVFGQGLGRTGTDFPRDPARSSLPTLNDHPRYECGARADEAER